MTSRIAWRALSALLVGLGASVCLAPRAAGHQVDPTVLTVIDELDPRFPGVEISVVTSVSPQLVATNRSAEVLEVLADTGEAFLRIGPDGVEANLASPSWYLTNQPFGVATLPDGVAPDAPARWGRVSVDPTWGWFDHRLHPADVGSVLGEAVIPRFEVPLRFGEVDGVLRGHLEQRTTRPVYEVRLGAVPRPDSGLSVQLLPGRAPGLFVRWDGADPLVVLGADDEPFARFGPTGVEVNRRSPIWRFTVQAKGEDVADLVADATAEPEWVLVSGTPAFGWIDERAFIVEPDDDIVQDWSIPIVLGGRTEQLTGRSTVTLEELGDVEALRAAGDSDNGPPAAVVVGVMLLSIAGVGWLLRRPRRS